MRLATDASNVVVNVGPVVVIGWSLTKYSHVMVTAPPSGSYDFDASHVNTSPSFA